MNRLNKNRIKLLPAMRLVFALCAIALFNACSNDFLKPTALSFYDPGTTLSTELGMKAVMGSADRQLRDYWTHIQFNTAANSNPIATEYMFSDLMVFGKTDEATTSLGYSVADQLTPQNAGSGATSGQSNGELIQYFWTETYNGIRYANTIISNINSVQGLDDATKNAYLGRAYFHRAFRYYNLVFQFGDIPLITKLPSIPKFNYRCTNKAAILDMITQDLEFAVQWVPDQKDMTSIGMVNKGACRMLLAKCYLATGQWQKAKDQMDTLIDQSGYSLVQGGAGLGQFGTFTPIAPGNGKTIPDGTSGGNPDTWFIKENVIWDLHRPQNKVISSNTEAVMVIPNAGFHTAGSFNTWLLMRVYGPYWNTGPNLTSPDGKGLLTTARSVATYNINLDLTRAFGRGIGVFRPTWFAQEPLWYVNGILDTTDLRHSRTVGNWVNMEDLKYNDPGTTQSPADFYGQHLMLYHPGASAFSAAYWQRIVDGWKPGDKDAAGNLYPDGTAKMEDAKAAMEKLKGSLLCKDTIRCWYEFPLYKYYLLDEGAEEVQTSTNFNGATDGTKAGHGDIYLYRLAEAYLVRAEAKFYLGDVAGATADVNAVRSRARCSQLYTTVNIGDIMNERARELLMEEWRHVELNRVSRCLALSGKPDEWGNTYNKDTYDKQSGRDVAGGSYWWQRICHYNNFYNSPNNPITSNNRTQVYNIDKHNMYWPIRQDVLDSNRDGKLMQAFGYAGYDASTPVWDNWQDAVADEDKTN